jgi:acyl dehydratase
VPDSSAERLYLDDLAAGQTYTTGSKRVDEAETKAFAAEFDPQPFHLDDAAARASLFGRIAASGWHTAAMSMRLLVEGRLRIAGGLVGLGGELSWPRPTYPGDTLTVESEVLDVKVSASKPDRGIVTVRNTTYNQRREPVQIAIVKMLVPRRPA